MFLFLLWRTQRSLAGASARKTLQKLPNTVVHSVSPSRGGLSWPSHSQRRVGVIQWIWWFTVNRAGRIGWFPGARSTNNFPYLTNNNKCSFINEPVLKTFVIRLNLEEMNRRKATVWHSKIPQLHMTEPQWTFWKKITHAFLYWEISALISIANYIPSYFSWMLKVKTSNRKSNIFSYTS